MRYAANTIKEIWEYQHPIMHAWFLASSLALGVTFAIVNMI